HCGAHGAGQDGWRRAALGARRPQLARWSYWSSAGRSMAYSLRPARRRFLATGGPGSGHTYSAAPSPFLLPPDSFASCPMPTAGRGRVKARPEGEQAPRAGPWEGQGEGKPREVLDASARLVPAGWKDRAGHG